MIRLYQWSRHATQILVVALFCLLPMLNGQQDPWLSGSLFAFDLCGIPLADPVAAVQGALAALFSGKAPALRLLLGGLLALAVALVLGRVFCSWLCPFGLCSEMVAKARSLHGSANGRWSRHAFAIRGLLLFLGLTLVLALNLPLLSIISMPGQMSLVPQAVREWLGHAEYAAALFSLAGIPVAVLVLEAFTGRRLWCRFVCPQSVLLGLAARCLPASEPGLRLHWQADKCGCKGKRPCQAACHWGCDPRKADRRDCTHCGDCVAACRANGGALGLRMGRMGA